jgi:hypothetical protein
MRVNKYIFLKAATHPLARTWLRQHKYIYVYIEVEHCLLGRQAEGTKKKGENSTTLLLVLPAWHGRGKGSAWAQRKTIKSLKSINYMFGFFFFCLALWPLPMRVWKTIHQFPPLHSPWLLLYCQYLLPFSFVIKFNWVSPPYTLL